MTKICPPALLSTEEFSRVTGVPVERLRVWARGDRAVVQPVEYTRGRAGAKYARKDVAAAVVLRELQGALGDSSALPFGILEALRPVIESLFAFDSPAPPQDGEPLVCSIEVHIPPSVFHAASRALDELA